MSKLELKTHMKLLKEARGYMKNVKPLSGAALDTRKGNVVLTEEHLAEWLGVFYDDRIMLDGCNKSKIKY
ncbi:hypothetical protein MNB_SM-4-1125 [hydrothermal vent metagenome]|uniref:Uncharacterized protein n=1 Tax=hydrothermal vent metagenome TaxID=652676 RepID=A0A1W1BWI6_9ZZZZ